MEKPISREAYKGGGWKTDEAIEALFIMGAEPTETRITELVGAISDLDEALAAAREVLTHAANIMSFRYHHDNWPTECSLQELYYRVKSAIELPEK